MLEKYESLSAKILFVSVGDEYKWTKVKEIQVLRATNSLVVVTTDGFKWLSYKYCYSPVQALKELRKLIRVYSGE